MTKTSTTTTETTAGSRPLPYTPRRSRVHWTTVDAVEKLAFDTRRDLEAGIDEQGEYVAVVTREGSEYRGRLETTERSAS